MTYRDFDNRRFWHLHETCQMRAKIKNGTGTRQELKAIQRQMAKDRATPLEKS